MKGAARSRVRAGESYLLDAHRVHASGFVSPAPEPGSPWLASVRARAIPDRVRDDS